MGDLDMSLLWHYVAKWAQRRPDEEALVFKNERITWREFGARVDSTAKALLELGIQKGDRVAFLGMARPEFLISFMAASKIGAIWLGLSPKFSCDELDYMLRNCSPKVLISLRDYMGRDLVPVGAKMVANIPSLDSVVMMGEPVEGTVNFDQFMYRQRPEQDAALARRIAEVDPGDNVLLMYTSGSTGRPKGVVHTHRSIISNIAVEAQRFELDWSGRLLLHFPINHVAADVEIGFAAVYAGCCTIMMDRFDPEQSLATIQRERITMVGQVPAMFVLQMQHPAWADTDFSSVQRFVWSGANASEPLCRALQAVAKKTGAKLTNAYGMTETGGLITYSSDDDKLPALICSAGKVAEPFELRIVDANRREVPQGATGEIAVRGDLVMKEYWMNPQATAEALDEEGWLYTSDLARLDTRGYIHIEGRRSEMFKSGGENVFPREIESVLESHPSILHVAVIAVPDDVYTEVGHAYTVLRPGLSATEEELREYCRQHLANFKIPKAFRLRPALPLLPNGKIDKQALRAEQ